MTVQPLCDLCGLPIPESTAFFTLTLPGQNTVFCFCCMGCRQVFAMIAEMAPANDPSAFKETALFRECQRRGIIPTRASDLETLAATSADPEMTVQPEFSTPPHHLTEILKVTDMWCPACAWFIETTLGREPGIGAVSCNFAADRLSVAYDPAVTSPEEIISGLQVLGYGALYPGETPNLRQTRKLFVRLMVALLFTANIMMLSFAAYSGFFIKLTKGAVWKIGWPVCLMAAIVVFYGGRPIYQKAFAGIRAAAFGMETLITAGAFTAFSYSFFNLVSGNVHLYFDTAAMLITLTLLGKLLEKRVKDRVTSDLEAFFSLLPEKARICSAAYPNGRYGPVERLSEGDLVWVTQEDVVPADGMVVEGMGHVDESVITGESRLIPKPVGAQVTGGTTVVSGSMKFRITALGPDTVIGQMMALVENAVSEKTQLEQYTEKMMRWFVPFIMTLAVSTGVVCYFTGMGLSVAVVRAVTVMVIACPCALGIAIPLVRVAGISVAGRQGVLVRDFAAFEIMRKVDTMVFDKTGTLTFGRWQLVYATPVNGYSQKRALALAAGLEKGITHDIALAVGHHARSRNIQPADVRAVRSYENGMAGKMGDVDVKIGSAEFMAEEIADSRFFAHQSAPAGEGFYSPVFLSENHELAAVFYFGDRIRPGTRKILSYLKATGIKLHIVSGDSPVVTSKVADALGIGHALGGQLPADKAAFVKSLKAEGCVVAMVGDGINDAAAMHCADMGIGISAKSLMHQENAHVNLMQADMSLLAVVIELAGRVGRKIRQNFWLSFLYNGISLPIAMSGLLTPLVAVTAMLCSSLTVIGNTLHMMPRKDTPRRAKPVDGKGPHMVSGTGF